MENGKTVAALDHDVIHFGGQRRVADQRQDVIIEILESVCGGHPDNLILVESSENRLGRVVRSGIAPLW